MGFNFGKIGNIAGMAMTLAGTVLAYFPATAPYGIALIVAGGALTAVTADAWEKKPDSPAMSGHRMNVRSSRQPLKLIYGEVEVGVNKTFYHLSNPYLHIICEIGEGPLYGIKQQSGAYYTTTATGLTDVDPPLVYMDNKLWTEYGGTVYMEWFDGSAAQGVCSTLQTASGGKWDQQLKHTSYLYVRLAFDLDYWKREPDITVVVRGLECYDPTAAATDWTDNPALHCYDLITRSSQRGGLGVPAAKIDTTALEASRAYCATKGWACNFPIGEQRPVADNLEQILGTFRGAIIYSEGLFKIRYMDTVANHYEATIPTYTESDVVAGTLSIAMPDISERYNAVRVTYLDAGNHFKPNDYTYAPDSAVTADGDYREMAVSLFGVTNLDDVQKHANYLLERNRLRTSVTLALGERAKVLEPNDLFYLTHSMPGWENELFRVQAATINADNTVTVSAINESVTLYDDVYNVSTQDYDTTTLLDPTTTPPEVSGVTLTETVYSYRLRSQSRLDVAFAPPANYPWFDHVEVWVSTDAVNWAHQFNARDDFAIDPVEEGQTYYIRLVTVNIFGTKIEFTSAPSYSKLIDGKSDSVPSSPTGITAILQGWALNLYGDRLTDDDIELYEYRLGVAWNSAVFLAAQRSPNLSLNGVKPGTHTFWLNSLGTNGLYGDTPVSVSVTVPDPPRGYVVGATLTGTTAGTYSTATDYLYNTSHYIQVTHSTAGLTGSYASTIFDASTSKQWLAYMQADFTVIGTGSLWSDLLPTTATLWSEALTTSRTWSEAFAPDAAPAVRMKINYGDTTALGSTLERMEILSGLVTGRYFRSIVSITDPQPSIYGIVQLPVLKLAT